jgi:hypothetical protein
MVWFIVWRDNIVFAFIRHASSAVGRLSGDWLRDLAVIGSDVLYGLDFSCNRVASDYT